MTQRTNQAGCGRSAGRAALLGSVFAAVIACVTGWSAPAWAQSSSWAQQNQITETWQHAPTETPTETPHVTVTPEFTLGGNFFSRAVGGYSFSGSGFSATGRALGMDRPLFGGASLRAGILIDRSFAIGAVGFVHGLVSPDVAPSSAWVASQVLLGQLLGGGGGLEIGSVLPLGRLSLRSTAVFGVFAMGAPIAGTAHTCTGHTRGGGTYMYTCYNDATMFAPFLQVRLAADYEVVDNLSVGIEGVVEPVPWFGWSAGLYVRLHFSRPAPARRQRSS